MLGEEVLRIIKILMESENPSFPYICRDQTDDVSGLDLYCRISFRDRLGDFLESSFGNLFRNILVGFLQGKFVAVQWGSFYLKQ